MCLCTFSSQAWFFFFAFKQTQMLAVKPRESLALPAFPYLKEDEPFLCFQKSAPEKLPVLSNSFIFHGSILQNPSQLNSVQAEVSSSKPRNFCLRNTLHCAQQDPKVHSLMITAAKAINNRDNTEQVFLVRDQILIELLRYSGCSLFP